MSTAPPTAQINSSYPNRIQLSLGDFIGPLAQPGSPPVDFDPRVDLEVYIDGSLETVKSFSFDPVNNRYLLFMEKNIDQQAVVQVVHHMPDPPFQGTLQGTVSLPSGIVQVASLRVGHPADTSSDLVIIGTGIKTFHTSGAFTYFVGQQVFIRSRGSGSFMCGVVTYYNSGLLTVDVPASVTFLPFNVDRPPLGFPEGVTFYSADGIELDSDWNIGAETYQIFFPKSPTPGNTILWIATGFFPLTPGIFVLDGITFIPGFTEVTNPGPWNPQFVNSGFWGSGYWRTGTTTVTATRPVLVGDSGVVTFGVLQTEASTIPPLGGTIEIALIEIFGVQSTSAKVIRGSNWPASGGVTFGPFASYGHSDFRVAVMCAGDGATIDITGSTGPPYNELVYIQDGTPSSALISSSSGTVADGGGSFTVTFGDAPTEGGPNTTTGFEAWLIQFLHS